MRHDKPSIGMNRTGIDMSPIDSNLLITAAENAGSDIKGDEHMLEQARIDCILDADDIGSVSPPGTIKGAISTAINKFSGKNIEVLIDKLGERIAFERTGVRLYDAMLAKVAALPIDYTKLLETFKHFRDEEAEHLNIAIAAMQSLGADATAQTPCADVVGVEGCGTLQVITDPRTSFSQSLHALLTAELTDNADWELLIKLMERTNKTDYISECQRALVEEQEHLQTIKNLLEAEILIQAV